MEVKLLGNTSKKYTEEQIRIVATAGAISRFPGNVYEIYEKNNSYEENIKYIQRVISLGHNSITDHDYLVFGIKDVSPIVEQILIEERFSSFTIKSRREVSFSDAGFYTPDFHNVDGTVHKDNELLKKYYNGHMKSLFESYNRFMKAGIPREDARFILPYCFHSNIVMGIDAHVLMNMIISFTKGKYSNVDELKKFGEELYKIMEVRAPYLKKTIDNSKCVPKDLIRDELDGNPKIRNHSRKILGKPILLSCSQDTDRDIFVSALMRVYGYEYDKANEIYLNNVKDNQELKNKLIKLISLSKEELKQVNFRFQVPISYASLTHLTRHRTHHLLIPDFVPVDNLNQYKIPNSIIENDYDIRYREIFRDNEMLYQAFKHWGVREEDLIYFHLSGNTTNVVCNMDGATLEHIASLRCCNRAQWEIREVVNEMVKLVGEKSEYYRSILGPTCEVYRECHEGKRSCGKIKQLILEDKKGGH